MFLPGQNRFIENEFISGIFSYAILPAWIAGGYEESHVF